MGKLICFDMDGVIFKEDSFWNQLHNVMGTEEAAKPLNEKYLRTDILKLAEEVIGKLWKGKDAAKYYELIGGAEYNPGAKKACKKLKDEGYTLLLLTSGPLDLALRAQTELGIDHVMANEILIDDGKFNGKYRWLIDPNNKVEALSDFCLVNGFDIEDVIVVGDNWAEVSLFIKAGKGIAFNSTSDELKQVADVVVDSNDLNEIMEHIR